MSVSDHVDLNRLIEGVKKRNPGQPEFVQAVQEVAEDIFDHIQDKEQYHEYQILRRIAEPDPGESRSHSNPPRRFMLPVLGLRGPWASM
jgi:hypothetical protein